MNESSQTNWSQLKSKLLNKLSLQPNELKPLLWSFLYFFSLLCSYYIIRPVRDEMGIQGGVKNLPWLFTATFVAMLVAVPLFGWMVKKYPRQKLIPNIYFFFVFNIFIFWLLFKFTNNEKALARAFFIWVSVFNLFVVSVFWSFMSDIFKDSQAKRLFGIISAGGSAGAIAGPSITALFSKLIGPLNLLPVSICFLLLAVFCVKKLNSISEYSAEPPKNVNVDNTGSKFKIYSDSFIELFSGAVRIFQSPYLMGISFFILLYSTLSTFLYFEQAELMNSLIPSKTDRTVYFAYIDLATNVLTVVGQLAITARFVKTLGISYALIVMPVLSLIGFLFLGKYPTLALLIVIQVLRRSGNYALTKPAREMLFTVVSKTDKYKAKNFMDTAVYRGGDALSGWAFAGLQSLGMTIATLPAIAIPISLISITIGWLLGKKQMALANNLSEQDNSKNNEKN